LATAELGVLPVTENDVGDPARNPWDLSRSSGGSSGGSSAAVASGMLPIAHASDGGGSIRIPAAFCHRFGFKPSLDLLGNMHGKVNQLGLSVMGPISLTVADAAAMLDVFSPSPPVGSAMGTCLKSTQTAPGKLKIKMVLDGTVSPVDPAFKEATRKVGLLLQEAGHEVVEAEALKTSVEEFLPVWQFMIAQVPVFLPGKLQPITRWLRDGGKDVTFTQAAGIQARYVEQVNGLFGDADILLTPTIPGPAPRIGDFPQSSPHESFFDAARFGSLTALFNLTCGPAASLPFGFTDEGLPIGVQLGARRGQDTLLLSLCQQVEERAPWRNLWPTIA
jgi:amidase